MIVRALVVAGVLWLAAILLAPLAIASSRGVLSVGAACTYAAGSRICHQRPDRCFWIHGRPMPVCARCAGIYAGAAVAGPLGLLLAGAWSSRRARLAGSQQRRARLAGSQQRRARLAGSQQRRARLALLLAALPTGLSWGLEYAGVAHPSNAVRAVLGLPLGFVVAWLVVGALAGDRMPRSNGT